MTEDWQDNFDALLAWLDSDRDLAGRKYEQIRENLINIFSWRGCYDAEDLADEAMTRVMRKVPDVAPGYKGDPALYFYAVGRNMLWEISRRAQTRDAGETVEQLRDYAAEETPDDLEPHFECLQECIQLLPARDRELVLLYYQQEKPNIAFRKELGRRLGIAPNNLRVRVHRIRTSLHACIVKCLKGKSEGETN